MEKAEARERAAYEIELFENRLELLVSVHKECSDPWDWESLKNADPPPEPKPTTVNERAARVALEAYSPSLGDRLLGRESRKREELSAAVDAAKKQVEDDTRKARAEYENDMEEWKKMREIAGGVLEGKLSAYEAAIREADPFSEISLLGSKVSIQGEDERYMEIEVRVNGEDVVPGQSKSLLSSGKLSVKEMPKGKFYELYQDHVCSVAIRAAREMLALLPIETVFFHAVADLLNTSTGHLEEQTILSVAMPRATVERLNFETIDCSDAMRNFVHRMDFKKTKGFAPVERLCARDLTT
jgi:hypothetical protein